MLQHLYVPVQGKRVEPALVPDPHKPGTGDILSASSSLPGTHAFSEDSSSCTMTRALDCPSTCGSKQSHQELGTGADGAQRRPPSCRRPVPASSGCPLVLSNSRTFKTSLDVSGPCFAPLIAFNPDLEGARPAGEPRPFECCVTLG